MHRALWSVQGILAVVFTSIGAFRLRMPLDEKSAELGLPVEFLAFISVAEVLGGLGLILPGLLRIQTGLTPLAAAGLTIIMAGAVGMSVIGIGSESPAEAVAPFALGAASAFVAYGRWVIAPLGRAQRPALRSVA